MKLLVTGGAGYVGSVCAARLHKAGHEVVVLDDLSTGHADAVPDGCRFVEADLADAAEPVLSEGFDGVLHFAAKSLVAESMREPGKYWSGNVLTSLRLLEAVHATATPRLVFSSTAAVYGEAETVPIPESAPTSPTNTYGATKLAIDHAITSYATAHGLAAVSLRYFNVAGAWDGYGERHVVETHLIPLVLRVALGQRDSIDVYGEDYPTADGTCVRDYIHVADLAEAHVLALEHARPRRAPGLQSGLRHRFLGPRGDRDLPSGHRTPHPGRDQGPPPRRPARPGGGERPRQGRTRVEARTGGPGNHRP